MRRLRRRAEEGVKVVLVPFVSEKGEYGRMGNRETGTGMVGQTIFTKRENGRALGVGNF